MSVLSILRTFAPSLTPYACHPVRATTLSPGLKPVCREAAGEVIASRHTGFKPGDKVVARTGWQAYGVSDGTNVRKIDATDIPLSAYLGVVGMPGRTAYIGLLDIGQPKSGETVVVSAASGAVGSVVGQIAK